MHTFLLGETLVWTRGHQVVPNLLWVFRPLTTTPSSWQVHSDRPGHCPSPPEINQGTTFMEKFDLRMHLAVLNIHDVPHRNLAFYILLNITRLVGGFSFSSADPHMSLLQQECKAVNVTS